MTLRGTIEQYAGPDGFAFDPYTVWAPVLGPIRAPLRCHDESVLVDGTTLVNTIRMRFLGLHVGTITMTLRRT